LSATASVRGGIGAGFHAAVFAVVRTVPTGAVTTYGDIAVWLHRRGVARQVGWALAALPARSDVPWWRVVAADGRLPRAGTKAAARHAARLRRDGVPVVGGRVRDFAQRRFALGS
jgi:methylated-DNA-protein-cysteine methyltransferase related protein